MKKIILIISLLFVSSVSFGQDKDVPNGYEEGAESDEEFEVIVEEDITVEEGFGSDVIIGMVIDGHWEEKMDVIDLFKEEILLLAGDEFDIEFPSEKTIVCDWTASGVNGALDKLLADPEVDIILAMGIIATNEACLRKNLPKPVVAPFGMDPKVQKLPRKGEGSGVENLNYLTLPSTAGRELVLFREIYPFKKLAIVCSAKIAGVFPESEEDIVSTIKDMGVQIQIIPIESSAEELFSALEEDVDSVYIAPLMTFSDNEFGRIVSGLIERKLPSFTVFGKEYVEEGILAGLCTESYFPHLARRVALNVLDILLGSEPALLPVLFTDLERLYINMTVADAIGVWPNWDVLAEARIVGGPPGDGTEKRKMSMKGAIDLSIKRNLDLAAERENVAAGVQDIKTALSVLFPQVDISASGLVVDKDRAETSMGTQPERSITGTATLTQIVFSEEAFANVTVQKYLQDYRSEILRETTLDTIADTADMYLNILKSKTLYRIKKDNLELTRSNLETAISREEIGVSGPAEVYRWETEIANSRKSVIDAETQVEIARMALNQLLDRPIEEDFITEEVDINDPSLIANRKELDKYLDNPWAYKIFRDFMVEEGFRNSPELAAFDALLASKERELLSAKRSFWMPTVALQGEVDRVFEKGGAGTGSSVSMFNLPDDTSWNVTLQASLPIFEGGAKFAKVKKLEAELENLNLLRDSTAEKIDQNIRTLMQEVKASYAGIELSEAAASSAHKNLELVKDSYSRGVVSILDLLDAQNAALVSDEVSADSIYDCMIDLINTERAVGCFYFFLGKEQTEEFLMRADRYFNEKTER